jgi:hypothetical protein
MTPLWTHLFGANPCWQRHSECSTHAEGPKRWKNLEGGDAWDVAMPCLWYFVVPFCRTLILTNICWCYPVIMSSKHLRTHSSTQQTTFGDTLRWQGVPCLDRFSPVIKMCTVPWWIMRDTQGAINLQIWRCLYNRFLVKRGMVYCMGYFWVFFWNCIVFFVGFPTSQLCW